MKSSKHKQALLGVFGARDDEIVCSEFADKLPRFVDLECAGENADKQMPEVRHHIHQCPECGNVYRALRDIVRAEG